MEHLPPARTADTTVEGLVPGMDPAVAVELMITEAEVLRLQADMMRATRVCLDESGPLRDLSPLGR